MMSYLLAAGVCQFCAGRQYHLMRPARGALTGYVLPDLRLLEFSNANWRFDGSYRAGLNRCDCVVFGTCSNQI